LENQILPNIDELIINPKNSFNIKGNMNNFPNFNENDSNKKKIDNSFNFTMRNNQESNEEMKKKNHFSINNKHIFKRIKKISIIHDQNEILNKSDEDPNFLLSSVDFNSNINNK